jgi:hypothetical protein
MFDHVFYSVLSAAFNLAFAILPAAPLFVLKRFPPVAVKNRRSGYRAGSKNGAQQNSAATMAE